MIDVTIYDRLIATVTESVDGRVYPIIGTEDTQLPCIIYSTEISEAGGNLTTRSGIYVYAANVDVFALDHDEVEEIAQAVIDALDMWHDGDVQLCRLKSSGQPQQQDSPHYQYHLEFTVSA